MRTLRSASLALVAGAVSGVVVLGLIGRVAMALVARSTGYPANLSVRGVLEVVVVGGFAGAFGGLLLLLARRMLPGRRSIQGAVVALALFVGSYAVALLGGRTAFDIHTAQHLITLTVVAIVFLVYGGAAQRLLGWLQSRDQPGD